MAVGNFSVFASFKKDLALGKHNFEADDMRIALTDGTVKPEATTTNPSWGAGGTNLKATEVRSGGNYDEDGESIDTTLSQAGGAVYVGAHEQKWRQDPKNPTNAAFAVVYNSVNNRCVGFADLGGAFNMRTGDLAIKPSSRGLIAIG